MIETETEPTEPTFGVIATRTTRISGQPAERWWALRDLRTMQAAELAAERANKAGRIDDVRYHASEWFPGRLS